MSAKTSIEWTDRTWNPVRGCTRVSEGCRNCYAERMAARNLPEMRSPTTGEPFATAGRLGPRWTGAVELIPSKLGEPLRWRKPARVFVNSMSDLFHESLPESALDAAFAVMARAHWHTFQVLTKRPARMLGYLRPSSGAVPRIVSLIAEHDQALAIQTQIGVRLDDRPVSPRWPLPNVWLGVSVEDQLTADTRIPYLEHTPAARRFVSYEPALGPVDWADGPLNPEESTMGEWSLLDRIDWVIVGGESGPGARPFDVAWARSTVAACKAANVAVFVKQLGARVRVSGDLEEELGAAMRGKTFKRMPECDGDWRVILRDRKGGDPAEWPEDLRVREFPS